jgi:hypothetical protein
MHSCTNMEGIYIDFWFNLNQLYGLLFQAPKFIVHDLSDESKRASKVKHEFDALEKVILNLSNDENH